MQNAMKSALSVRSKVLIRNIAWILPLAIGFGGLAMANPVVAQEEQMLRVISVTGQGTESIPTTITQVQLGVEAQGKTAEEVQQEVARRSNAVIEFLRSRNVDKLQTTGIYLSPQYDYTENRQRLIGYTASNTVSFRMPTEQVGALLDQAVSAGASRIDGVSFVAEDAAIEAARQTAIQEAIENAQTQADSALSVLGLSRREIVGIQVNGAPPPVPLFSQRAVPYAAEAASAAPTPVVGGEQEVQASVTLQIRY